MKAHFPPWLQLSLILLLWGLVFYLAGLPSLIFDDPNSSIAIIWFPAGVAVAAFLSARWRDYPALIIIFTLVTVLLDEQWETPLNFALSLLYAFLSILSPVVIAWVVRRFARLNDALHIIQVWIMATLAISTLDSLVVSGGYAVTRGLPIFSLFWQEFIADVAGIFFAAPIVMGFINKHEPSLVNNLTSKCIGLVLWLVLCAITGIVFGYDLPWAAKHGIALYFCLACLPIAAVMMLSVFWGNLGGSIALLTLGAIVIYYTDQNRGPFFLKKLAYTESLLLALSYLSATALMVVFIRIVRHSTNNLDPETGRVAGNGVFYRLAPASGTLFWENSLSALPGNLEPTTLSNVEDVLQRVHPSDKDKLRTHWLSVAQGKRAAMIFRIQASDGKWMTLVDSGSMHMVTDDEDIIVGNWQASCYHLVL